MVLVAIVLLLALFVAIVLPYGEWDAMAFGTWSRLIAEHWPHVRFESVAAADYHRPLFYVLQGWVWSLFGFHQSLGRVLSLLFSLTLVASVAWTAAQTVRVHRAFVAALAAVVVVLIVPFERYVDAGLSDIPVAAMLAVTAALFSRRDWAAHSSRSSGQRDALVLAKPSALPASQDSWRRSDRAATGASAEGLRQSQSPRARLSGSRTTSCRRTTSMQASAAS
jgi:hypothetical protein